MNRAQPQFQGFNRQALAQDEGLLARISCATLVWVVIADV